MAQGYVDVDLIIHGSREILTLPRVVRGRADRGFLGVVEDGAIAISHGVIAAIGPEDEILRRYRARMYIDASNYIATPGLIDPHTHLLYSGSREDERELILGGVSYTEILARGGGILRTMRLTSRAGRELLITSLRERLNEMLESGVTTVEIKTGYGIDIESELRLVEVLAHAAENSPVNIVSTLLAHIPLPNLDFKSILDGFERVLIPRALELGYRFVDVFCDKGAFNPSEARAILAIGKSRGLIPRIHADEFSYIGCSDIGLELGASSLDHLNHTPIEVVDRISSTDSTAVLAPSTAIATVGRKPPSKELLERGAIIAIATDHSPSLMNLDMVATIDLAVNYLSLPPANAIAAATVNAAYSLGLGGRVGSLIEGSRADIVLWAQPSYRWFGYLMRREPIACVIKDGVLVKDIRGCEIQRSP
ncbi:MAG: imidazolonepropionase [Sulfolobales archaeon]